MRQYTLSGHLTVAVANATGKVHSTKILVLDYTSYLSIPVDSQRETGTLDKIHCLLVENVEVSNCLQM